jgi:repressor LexA
MREELTARQRELLTYLDRELKRHGRIPSLRSAVLTSESVTPPFSKCSRRWRTRATFAGGSIQPYRPFAESCGRIPGRTPVERDSDHRRIAAGLPIYAQQEWAGTVVVDVTMYAKPDLFALRIKGDSMREAGILDGDLVICEPRQFAEDGEIVVALIHSESATVKRFYLHRSQIELRPANKKFKPTYFRFDEILIQGKSLGCNAARKASSIHKDMGE